MKHLIITTLFILLVAGFTCAQPTELFTKNWKIETINSVLNGNTSILFHKDSASNILDYSSLKYVFFNNGTYTIISDTTSSQGTWSLNPAVDSTVIDNIPYKLIELSSTHFTTRSFALQVVDSIGAGDTSFTYVALYPVAPLPVKLMSFIGKYTNNAVQLNWSTAQEQQSKEFQVQYSANGTLFETIGTVAAKGNSATAESYLFNSGRYQTGKNYYRLKQVDLDGRSVLSPVVIISIDASRQFVISLSPNPTSNVIKLSFSQAAVGKLQLVLTTVSGQQVWSTRLTGNTTNATVSLPALTKGIYIANVINEKGEKIFNNKLIIQ